MYSHIKERPEFDSRIRAKPQEKNLPIVAQELERQPVSLKTNRLWVRILPGKFFLQLTFYL